MYDFFLNYIEIKVPCLAHFGGAAQQGFSVLLRRAFYKRGKQGKTRNIRRELVSVCVSRTTVLPLNDDRSRLCFAQRGSNDSIYDSTV